MPCHYGESEKCRTEIQYVNVDNPTLVKKIFELEKLLCNAGFIIRNHQHVIIADEKEVNEILAWHKQHRFEEAEEHLKVNEENYKLIQERIRRIEEMGGEASVTLWEQLNELQYHIAELQTKIQNKSEDLLYSREDDRIL